MTGIEFGIAEEAIQVAVDLGVAIAIGIIASAALAMPVIVMLAVAKRISR